MTLPELLAAVIVASLAVAHSVLGEVIVVRPLLADPRWHIRVPRGFADGIVRFAWHLPTIAWLALAGAAVGLDATVALTVTALVSAVLIVVLAPGHLAWPLLLVATLLGGSAMGVVTDTGLTTLSLVAAGVAGVGALVHVAWGLGYAGTSARLALPSTTRDEVVATPSRVMTLLVAGALAILAVALAVVALATSAPWPPRALVAGALVVLVARTVGDRRYIGLSKTVRGTAFARRDDRIFTPIVISLALGAGAALTL